MDITPEEMAGAVQEAVRRELGVMVGRIRADGRDAAFAITLSSGQTFKIKIEEIDV